jgi:ubiquinone/menaquinone biosynthesis C-methylase UbiE
MNSFKIRLRSAIIKLLSRLSPQFLERFLLDIAAARSKNLSAKEGLGFILGLEAGLYPMEGNLAIDYGGGMHTKHRHMRYEDFFVARIKAGEHVLDVGSGSGLVAMTVAEQANAYVWGIDMLPHKIALAKERHSHPRVTYILGDVMNALPNEHFDVIILSNVLEHLRNRPEFLLKVQTVAKPSRMLIRVPLFDRDWRVPLKKELGIEWRLDPTHETEYTLESFQQEMDEAKLDLVHIEFRWGEIWSELKVRD